MSQRWGWKASEWDNTSCSRPTTSTTTSTASPDIKKLHLPSCLSRPSTATVTFRDLLDDTSDHSSSGTPSPLQISSSPPPSAAPLPQHIVHLDPFPPHAQPPLLPFPKIPSPSPYYPLLCKATPSHPPVKPHSSPKPLTQKCNSLIPDFNSKEKYYLKKYSGIPRSEWALLELLTSGSNAFGQIQLGANEVKSELSVCKNSLEVETQEIFEYPWKKLSSIGNKLSYKKNASSLETEDKVSSSSRWNASLTASVQKSGDSRTLHNLTHGSKEITHFSVSKVIDNVQSSKNLDETEIKREVPEVHTDLSFAQLTKDIPLSVTKVSSSGHECKKYDNRVTSTCPSLTTTSNSFNPCRSVSGVAKVSTAASSLSSKSLNLLDNWIAAKMVYYANMQYLAHCGNVHGVTLDEGVTYMVSGNTPTLDADAQANLAHATRVSPATVQWLMENYETADGVSLPRSTLYNHYLRHCADNKLDPVNAASFGKLIRSVFLGLRTRRLGTRGNSKYHYYGIRLKPSSPLVNLSDDGSPVRQQSSGGQGKKIQAQVQQSQQQQQSPGTHSQQGKGVSSSAQKQNSDSHYDSHTQASAEASPQTLQQQHYLGDMTVAVPMLPEVDFGTTPLPVGVTRAHLHTFTVLYKEHCETILEAVYNLQFSAVEGLWRRFWMINNNNNVAVEAKSSSSEISDDDDGDLASLLPSSVLQALLRAHPIIDFVRSFDYQFYQNLVEVLIPDVLRSIPSSLTQAIRNFAKSLEAWLSNAMVGCPPDIVNIKVSAVSSFAQTLRRYTSLNHLAQAARAVLQNSSQISQMLADLNRVDFHNVQEQASWVCQCDADLVDRLEEDFKATLQQQNSLEEWAAWLQEVVNQVLRPHEGKADFPKQARQFLLKWSFYSSMVIRDLTLRSAASFGSFHLIRLLYDEYMFYLVEHKVATSLGLTPIAVISQVSMYKT
ncbi:Transcription factor rfx3 [Halocaridina rubra]|uniref:Transcription factor rfx3 n=1 Tax=Halocaridina rubra TaxID=373956 RepID=A0AAN9AF68_HALRR